MTSFKWPAAVPAAGSVTWGTIGGTLSNQSDLAAALAAKAPSATPTLTGTVTITDGATDPVLLVKSGAFSGARFTQDSGTGHAKIEVLDVTRDLNLLPGSTSGIIRVGYLGGSGGFQAYTSLPYSIIAGFVGANTDNTHSLGTDETGAFVNGNRWKDGFFGTSLRAPLFSYADINSGSAAQAVTVRGANNAGAGAGGNLSLSGGTSGSGATGIATIDSAQGNAYQFDTPAAAGTVTIGSRVSVSVIDPAGTIASLTITLPASPQDKQRIRVGSSQIVTVLTVNAAGAETVKDPVTSLAAGGTFEYIYRSANTTWYKIG